MFNTKNDCKIENYLYLYAKFLNYTIFLRKILINLINNK